MRIFELGDNAIASSHKSVKYQGLVLVIPGYRFGRVDALAESVKRAVNVETVGDMLPLGKRTYPCVPLSL